MFIAALSTTFLLISSAAPASLFQNAPPDQGEQQDQNAADSPDPNDFLAIVAVRIPESVQLFKTLPQGNLPESSFAALHEIFVADQDTFYPDDTISRWVSLRGLATERLKQSGPAVLRAWNRTALASSETAWEVAVQDGDLASAASIAAGWPLSELHLRLSLLQSLEAWQAGEFRMAEATINQTFDLYDGTFLEPRARTLLQPLQRRLQITSPKATPDNPSEPFPTPLPLFPPQQPVSTVSIQQSVAAAPWPRPLWTWRESVQSQNAELQQSESNLLLAQDPQTAATLGSLQLWRPLCWGPWVICRTPSRIVALDRRTGKECWLVETDPALRNPGEKSHLYDTDSMDFNSSGPHRPISNRTLAGESWLSIMSICGLSIVSRSSAVRISSLTAARCRWHFPASIQCFLMNCSQPAVALAAGSSVCAAEMVMLTMQTHCLKWRGSQAALNFPIPYSLPKIRSVSISLRENRCTNSPLIRSQTAYSAAVPP